MRAAVNGDVMPDYYFLLPSLSSGKNGVNPRSSRDLRMCSGRIVDFLSFSLSSLAVAAII